jgi:hypothetical protein
MESGEDQLLEAAGTVPAEVKLGGKLFSVVVWDSINFLNECYVMKIIRETQIDLAMPQTDGETDAAYLFRLQSHLVDTMRLHELLAGFLLPQGRTETDWTPHLARETAAFIAALSTPDDRAEVHRLALGFVFSFFARGIDSLKTSQNVLSGASGTIPSKGKKGGRIAV